MRFVALTGPTAVGKTALALPLARALDAEIVSMDSRQVYRGLDIGTAKASPEERGGIPHHGLDLVGPGERFSAGRFARTARRWIAAIEERGGVPLLVGGTGFFLRALTDPVFREPAMDRPRRDRLRTELDAWPRERLERAVRCLDPKRAELAREGGRQRMGRTVEVALLTGRPLSWWHRHAPAEAAPLRGLVVVLERPREDLDRRIDERVERMIGSGLLEEVRALLEGGVGPDAPGMTATGYREVVAHLRGERTVEEAARDIATATRRYARRQLTWFRNQLPDDALRLDARLPAAELVERIRVEWEARRSGAREGVILPPGSG